MNKLIYFGAEWCGPCKLLKPQLKASGLAIKFIDVDLKPDEAAKYSIRNIPTIIAVNNSNVVARKVGGEITIAAVQQMLNK